MKYAIRTEPQRAEAIRALESASLPCRMELREGADRSLEQNRLAFLHYGEIGKHYGLSVDEAHRLCKLRYGAPILRRDSEEFEDTWQRVIAPLDHEDQMRAMGLIDVTSIMTVRQMGEYLDTMYRDQVSRGVHLTDPGEPYAMREAAKGVRARRVA